eukprot:TRINITY_DN43198_c0_g1_i1.p1 TRINITY_DN43198_c0_g1~~TRINITY_DN43198_c0_g1_i1.p1  ORF type:complete len:555 (+),score=68.41 TRINITY_DN43198_c0_g1_i1:290-1954(+)
MGSDVDGRHSSQRLGRCVGELSPLPRCEPNFVASRPWLQPLTTHDFDCDNASTRSPTRNPPSPCLSSSSSSPVLIQRNKSSSFVNNNRSNKEEVPVVESPQRFKGCRFRSESVSGKKGLDFGGASPPLRRLLSRETETDVDGKKFVRWSKDVDHIAVARVGVQVITSKRKKVATIGSGFSQECGLEAWAESHDFGSGPVKLALCKANLNPKTSHLSVHWLWREKVRPPISSDSYESTEIAEGECWRFVKSGCSTAQAVFGILASVGEIFGMIVVDLEAEDNGSGKLVDFYKRIGLSVRQKAVTKRDLPYMEGPIKAVSCLAPCEWFEGLVPANFDPWEWLQDDVSPHQVERLLLSPSVPWNWSFGVCWPHGSELKAKLSFAGKAFLNKIDAEVSMIHRNGVELTFARGAIRIKESTLRVIWMGRSKSRPVHPNVRGEKKYCRHVLHDDKCVAEPTATAAVATLGALAALARWFGTTSIELLALDSGSGKLWTYLAGLGFSDLRGGQVFSVDDPPVLATSCRDIAFDCCPPEWRTALPIDGELSILSKMIGRGES